MDDRARLSKRFVNHLLLWIAVSALGLCPAPFALAGATILRFSPQQVFDMDSTPSSGTTADINSDGKPDLIVPIANNDRVLVLLNTTTPGSAIANFDTAESFDTGGSPIGTTTTDVNGDGKPDLTIANYVDNTISVLLNTTASAATTPSFAAQQIFATGEYPISILAADINGDGLSDLAVANYLDHTVSVLLNTTIPGATVPSFASQQTFATDLNPYSVTAADVNSDAKPDLIAANFYSYTVSVLLNTTVPHATTPSFAAQRAFATGRQPTSVAAADINGDRNPDLIVANISDDTVSVLVNTTEPGDILPNFAPQRPFAGGPHPNTIIAADVNLDGEADVIVTNYIDETLSVLLSETAMGPAIPRFAALERFKTGHVPVSVTVADINIDGRPDLVVANYVGGTVSVLLNATTFEGHIFASGFE